MQTFIRGLLPIYKRTVLSRGPLNFEEACRIAQEDVQQDTTMRTLNDFVTQVNQLQSTVSSRNTTKSVNKAVQTQDHSK